MNTMRVKKEITGRSGTFTERYVYDGEDLLLVTDGGYAVQHRYVHGPGVDQLLIDEVTGGTNVWLMADCSGSVMLMVPFDFDQSGASQCWPFSTEL